MNELQLRIQAFYERPPIKPRGFWNGATAAFSHAATLMVRRQRLILAAIVALLPVAVPVATAFFNRGRYGEPGGPMMAILAERLHIHLLAPLLALFFATMLVGEEVEGQTMTYLLVRPTPKSSWIAGRYAAYLMVSSLILTSSVFLTYAACTALADFPVNAANTRLAAHYAVVAIAALAAYGALMVFLGAVTRRPIILGVVLLYGWEKLANVVPGVVDFLTIQKYAQALLPRLAGQRNVVEIQTELGTWEREVFLVDASKAAVVLCVIILAFLAMSVVTVRWREYYPARTMT